ncbi:EamA-like transporter family protein [Tepidimonas aquatica]|uniref:EamA-like transporter family protein n=1 Tax=Tepidimonas aquatica TaxID=247482 RepID=A0A554WUA5_9BURK|nr:EamA-like transporter family protein [Tepidimonas aquatica]
MPNTHHWRTDVLMLLTAAIWGSTFVAQQLGMASVGPFAYTAARMTLGLALIAPLWSWRGGPFAAVPRVDSTGLWRDGTLLGLVLFAAINLQQVGLLGTSVSNAGFITGLYVVLVPLLLALGGRRVAAPVWLAVALATAGLYLLSVQPDASIAPGDWLQLGGALLWAVHVLLVGRYARRHDALRLAVVQYAVAAALSWGGGCAARRADGTAGAVGGRGRHRLGWCAVDRGGLHPAGGRAAPRPPHPRGHHLQQRGGVFRAGWLVGAG